MSLTPDDFKVVMPVVVRWRDCDAMGHVNNAVFFTYFEMARGEYLVKLGYQEQGSIRDVFRQYPFILGEVGARFVSQGRLRETILTHIRLSEIGRKSYQFDYLLTSHEDGRVIATGRSTQIFFDYERQETIPVPDAFVRLAEAFEGRPLRKPA